MSHFSPRPRRALGHKVVARLNKLSRRKHTLRQERTRASRSCHRLHRALECFMETVANSVHVHRRRQTEDYW